MVLLKHLKRNGCMEVESVEHSGCRSDDIRTLCRINSSLFLHLMTIILFHLDSDYRLPDFKRQREQKQRERRRQRQQEQL
jgi:hypothetical protein